MEPPKKWPNWLIQSKCVITKYKSTKCSVTTKENSFFYSVAEGITRARKASSSSPDNNYCFVTPTKVLEALQERLFQLKNPDTYEQLCKYDDPIYCRPFYFINPFRDFSLIGIVEEKFDIGINIYICGMMKEDFRGLRAQKLGQDMLHKSNKSLEFLL